MPLAFEDLQVLQASEKIADQIWKDVLKWDGFAKDVVGKQLTRAADSIGANIAEGFGRFNFGEKVTFLYYSRGSLYETKYWLDRASKRQLMPEDEIKSLLAELSAIARQLNSLASRTKQQRAAQSNPSHALHESSEEYSAGSDPSELFSETDLIWFQD